jgi:cobalt-zinc-cadmium efflux system outer membrane protein
LSRADFNQAEGLLAQAQALRAEAGAFEAQARYRLQSLSGQPPASTDIEPEPLPASAVNVHPLLRELHARRDLARRGVELARAQNRANPELAVSTRRDRAGNGEPNEQTWALSLRIPFAGGPRHDARVATANADAIEADIELAREEERLQRETEAMRLQLEATRQQLTAAETRARLAADNRGFYEKSFRLGESDLPTRLRIEAEAFEAERALGRARIGLAQGISQLRQVLGLLPE